jgi:hypothetical protein
MRLPLQFIGAERVSSHTAGRGWAAYLELFHRHTIHAINKELMMNNRLPTQAVSLLFAALVTLATFVGIDTLATVGAAPVVQASAGAHHG